MSRALTPGTSLDSLKNEARQWLAALRRGDEDARARLIRAHPAAPPEPGLRGIQHAIALEHGFASWAHLKTALEDLHRQRRDARALALQALLAAADKGEAARVREIVDRHPYIVNDRATLAGHTGLRTALHFGVRHEAVIRALLARGADPNIRDEGDNAYPLHFAAERQDLPVVRLLIEHGADPIGDGDDHELSVIGWATAFDYLTANQELVDYLLAHGARHTIFSAVAVGDVDAIRRVAAQPGIDLDRRMDRTNHRRRPLHLAVVKRQAGSLAALLELGTDVEAQDEAGLTPLDQAALDGAGDLVQRLIDGGAAIRLPAAVALHRTGDIERLVAEDPECLQPGRQWGTLIVRASERASGEIVETLIRLGASIDVWDDPKTAVDRVAGYTPLHAAASRGNASAAAALLKHGATLTVRDHKYGGTAAGWANYLGHPDVRDLILAGPIDIFEALDFDLSHRIPEILARDPEARDRPFRAYATLPSRRDDWPDPACTPLVWAVIRNRAEAAALLLDRGATVTAAPDGRTLRDIADEKGREQVADVLRHRLRSED